MTTLLRLGLWASLLAAGCGPANPDTMMDVVPMDAREDVPRDVPQRDVQRDVQYMLVCPMSAPTGEGGFENTCSRIGHVCTFGDDPRPECRVRAECINLMWHVQDPECPPYDPSPCPEAAPDADSECSDAGQYCSYPPPSSGMGRVHYRCTNCPPGGGACTGPTLWRRIPQADGGCPTNAPSIGSFCQYVGLRCTYDVCGEGSAVGCDTENTWQNFGPTCTR
jgi:hypothetical protein